MANHPNLGRSYWFYCPRGFANEYSVGIATNAASAKTYQDEGYARIPRDRALRELTDRGDNATEVCAGVTVNNEYVNADRFEIARAIREGQLLN